MSRTVKIEFRKYSATGNDFIVIDDRKHIFPTCRPHLIRELCTRRTGIGADGILLLQESVKADFTMRYFNADGGEAEMCGNGARAIVHFANALGVIGLETTFETMNQLLQGKIKNDRISIRMNQPGHLQEQLDIHDSPLPATFAYVEIGVPHLVAFVDDVAKVDVNKIGPGLAHNKMFANGTNVDFVQIKSEHAIKMRTYERGVEAETLSCGTGATASAVLTSLRFGYTSPISVQVPGGELRISFTPDFQEVWLSGPVKEVFAGSFDIPG